MDWAEWQSADRQRQYCFGAFILDLDSGFLRCGDEEIALRPKSFQVLAYLVKHHGRLISRDELMREIWADVAVTDEAVTKCIADIRKALQDDDQRLIRTVARRGYVLTAAVTTPVLEISRPGRRDTSPAAVLAQLPKAIKPELLEPAWQPDRSRSVRWGWAAALTAVLAAAGGSIIAFRATGRSRPTAAIEYTQITNFTDAAFSPTISADGRMLAFIRGQDVWTLGGPGNLYIKFLPDGEPVPLTHDSGRKMSPVFTPGGDTIAYGVPRVMSDPKGWSTWIVPVFGGAPTLLLSNSSALTWIPRTTPPRVLFSEVDEGIHMPIVTAAENRTGARTVYSPGAPSSMAHRSYLSPDGKNVLVVEMDAGGWRPCLLTPFEPAQQAGASAARLVGPSPGQCSSAAWSPDGKWMYLTVNTGAGYHIWRQRFPNGAPEQVTFGATEEREIAFAPDGESFFTSVGTAQSTLWIHDKRGDRQITSEGYASLPQFSADGEKLYFLLRSHSERRYLSGELWVSNLETGQRERLLRGFQLEHYSIAADGNRIVFVALSDQGESRLWLGTLDGRVAPRRLSNLTARRAFFGAHGDVLFSADGEGNKGFIYRVKEDGSGLHKAIPDPVIGIYAVSPDGKAVAAWPETVVQVLPIDGTAPVNASVVCAASGGENSGVTPPCVSWSPDGTYVYLNDRNANQVYAIPIPRGRILPALPAGGVASLDDVAALPGARVIRERFAFIGPHPSVYAFFRVRSQYNIYRVRLP